MCHHWWRAYPNLTLSRSSGRTSYTTHCFLICPCLDSFSGTQELNSDDSGIQAVPQYVKRVVAVAGNNVEVRNSLLLVGKVQVSGIKNKYHAEIGTYSQCWLITHGKWSLWVDTRDNASWTQDLRTHLCVDEAEITHHHHQQTGTQPFLNIAVVLNAFNEGKGNICYGMELSDEARDLFVTFVYSSFLMQVRGGVLYLNDLPQPGTQVCETVAKLCTSLQFVAQILRSLCLLPFYCYCNAFYIFYCCYIAKCSFLLSCITGHIGWLSIAVQIQYNLPKVEVPPHNLFVLVRGCFSPLIM